MPAGLRRFFTLALVFGSTGFAVAQTPLPANSPFLSGGSVSPPAAATPGGLEFVAVLTEGQKTNVSLYDPVTKKSRWIPVRGEADGIAVLSYDALRNQVVVRTGGAEKQLTLRREKSTVAGATANGAPVFPSSTTASAVVSGTSVPPPTAKLPGPTPSPPVVKEQEEARLLVSDLLEIGLAQRKAHEEMQKKVAPVPAPAPPAKPSGG